MMIKPLRPFAADHTILKFAAALILLLLTYILFGVVDRFDTVATNIVPNLSFEEGVKHWSGSPKGVTLKNKPLPVVEMQLAPNPAPLILARTIPEPGRFSHIRVGADIKLNGVQRGKVWWEQAGIIVRSLDGKGLKIPFWPYKVVTKSGTTDWERHEAVIPVSGDARGMRLFIFLDGRTGMMEVTNITIDSAAPSAWVPYGKAALIAAWVIFGLWILAPIMFTNKRNPWAYLALFAFLATLVAVLAPQPQLSNTAVRTLKTVASVFETAPKKSTALKHGGTLKTEAPKKSKPPTTGASRRPSFPDIRIAGISPRAIATNHGSAVAHLISHAAFTFFTVLAFPFAGRLILFAALSTAAATTETLQVFVISRTTNWDDLAMNLTGVATGLAVALAWRFIWRRLFARPNSPAP